MNRFQNGERVCFVGDSITHNGTFIKQIVAYYRAYLPQTRVEIYNCGIAGGSLGNTIKVFDEDIAIYDPTHIVLMIGVNDSRRTRLSEPASRERYEYLLAAYEKYKNHLEEFYQITRERGIKLTLCTPVPYDEYGAFDTSAFRGGYALIMGYADVVRAFAVQKGLDWCDYHAAMTRAMQTEVLYAPDRVHPTEAGHLVMARAFLAAQGIELAEPVPYSEELEEWYRATQNLRNTVAAEFLLVPGYTEYSDEERSAQIRAMLEQGDAKLKDPYIHSLAERHVSNKPRQKELIELVKRYMKQ